MFSRPLRLPQHCGCALISNSNLRRFTISTATLKNTKSASPAKDARDAKQFAIECATLAANTRCVNVAVMDVKGLSPITDYFVLATGTSGRQMKAVADEMEEVGATKGHVVISRSIDEQWILLDFVDVVVHIFAQEARQFYDLESLWGDAKRVEWK